MVCTNWALRVLSKWKRKVGCLGNLELQIWEEMVKVSKHDQIALYEILQELKKILNTQIGRKDSEDE